MLIAQAEFLEMLLLLSTSDVVSRGHCFSKSKIMECVGRTTIAAHNNNRAFRSIPYLTKYINRWKWITVDIQIESILIRHHGSTTHNNIGILGHQGVVINIGLIVYELEPFLGIVRG